MRGLGSSAVMMVMVVVAATSTRDPAQDRIMACVVRTLTDEA
jgi:hypothetical protein